MAYCVMQIAFAAVPTGSKTELCMPLQTKTLPNITATVLVTDRR